MRRITETRCRLRSAAQALDLACRLGAVQLLCICPPPNVRAPSLRLLLPPAAWRAMVQHVCSVRFRVLRAVPRPGAQMLHAAQERPVDESAASRRSARPTLMLNRNAASDGCREEAIPQACSLGGRSKPLGLRGSSLWRQSERESRRVSALPAPADARSTQAALRLFDAPG
jgi:hypothetical protein